MRIIDASTDTENFFVRVTDDGRLLYCRDKIGDSIEMLRAFENLRNTR